MYGIAIASRPQDPIYYPYASVEPIVYKIGFAVVLLYYLIVWAIYGRDAKQGTVIPEWELTDELSPADIVYIRKRGFDKAIFVTCLISMISKGYLTISNQSGVVTLHKLKSAGSSLSVEEKAIATHLFNSDRIFELSLKNRDRLLSSSQAAEKLMRQKHKNTYFILNNGWFALAVTASILVIISGYAPILLQSTDQDHKVRGLGLWLSVWSFFVFMLATSLPPVWHQMPNIPKGLDIEDIVCGVGLPLGFFGVEAAVLAYIIGRTSPTVLIACAAFVLLNWLFWHLLKTLTPQGAKMLDRIKGLQMYLETAEEERLSSFDPLKTNEVFEKFFPYAFALDIDQKWSEQFDDVISAALVGTVNTLWAKGTPAPKTSAPAPRPRRPRH